MLRARLVPMKVRFPLSLKVTLWLLLNLLLLGVAAGALLIAQGGLRWDSLVAGNPGDRLHALANAIAGEAAAAPTGSRDEVLARFGTEFNTQFILFRNRGQQIAGPRIEIPAEVRNRLAEWPGGPRGFGRTGEMGPPNRDFSPPDRLGTLSPQAEGPMSHVPARGRFLVRAGDPTAWWIGLRVPFAEGSPRLGPATLLIRADSFWNIILLLNLETALLIAAAILAFSILFWLPLVRSITRSLRAVTDTTEKIAEGKFEARVQTRRSDEIGRLGESVNTMAARLDTLVNGQKRFLGDVAHELGSPIGRLQVAAEILEQRATPELREQVKDVREEVQQMATLVNELLAFTKAGMRPRDLTLTPIAVDVLFSTVASREDPEARVQRAIAPSGLYVLGDEALLTRALANLLRNAQRYAGSSATISLSARGEADHVIITVDDDGPGVPEAALTRMGEPFFRPEFARSRETGGVGLGLAIVRASVTACGGDVVFENRSPHGFRAALRLKASL